jgi:predicted NBD/HSP70 family sugar kinase
VVPLGPDPRQPALLSTTYVGGANRAHILLALADHGPLSRADLARMAGVTRASISGIVVGLLDEGILQEQAVITNSGRVGKPSRPVWFGDTGTYGAVVMQPENTDVAIVTSGGQIIEKRQLPSPTGRSTPEFDRQALAGILDLLQPHVKDLRAVGLAVPAVFNAEGDLVASTTIPFLVGSRLPDLLAQALDSPVILEDDARALALGLRWFGQARGEKDFAALQIGEGIGAGIMLDGRLHRGPLMVSEIGHMTVDLNGERCRCGLSGCWETIASLRWLRSSAEKAGLPGAAAMTPTRLAGLHAEGDARASELIDDYADHVAVGIVNLFHTLSVPLFILDGEVVGAGERFLERLRERVNARTMPALTTRPEIKFAESKKDSGVLGAAAAAVTFMFGVRI